MAGGLVLAASKFGLLPRNGLTEHATQVGTALEVILLSLSLAGRLQHERRLREQAQAEATRLPVALDYTQVRGLSKEVQQKLNQHKPETIGQVGRIQGVTPAAISLLLVWLKRRDLAARAGAAAPEAAALAKAADDVARRPAA